MPTLTVLKRLRVGLAHTTLPMCTDHTDCLVPFPPRRRPGQRKVLHTHLDSRLHRSYPHTLASHHIARGGVCTGWHHCDTETAQGCTEALWTKGQEAVKEVAQKQKPRTELYPRQGSPGTSSPDAEQLPQSASSGDLNTWSRS